ncbi:hypothetical protein Hanom_Chr12g01110511 [Helianthus anomalus]
MGGFGSSQGLGSSQSELYFFPETKMERQLDEEEPETPPNKTKHNKQVSHKKKEITETRTRKTVRPWDDEEVRVSLVRFL